MRIVKHDSTNKNAGRRTSFWMVIDTRSRFECGSVQMKCASVRRTLFKPLSFLRHMESSSEDSGRASVHVCGGDRKRSQFRQKDTDAGVEQMSGPYAPSMKLNPTLLRDALCNIYTAAS
jgi:hypothetical protein